MRRIREILRWMCVLVLSPFHLLHYAFYGFGSGKTNIKKDLHRYKNHFNYEKCPDVLYLYYLLTTDRYFRQLFYHRIGPVASILISWYRPGEKYFIIPKELKMEGGCIVFHPYSTVLNAESIGKNFSCAHCTTLGWGERGASYNRR